MKRIKAACITQTLHFLLKEDVSSDYAKKLVTEEVKKYKDSLNKNRTLLGLVICLKQKRAVISKR